MSKVLIDRELLERAVYRLELAYDADAPIVCDLSSVLAAPSGTPAMPVKAYYHEVPNEYGGLNKSVGLEVRKAFTDAPLVLESDALARIACLEGEIAKRDARIAELEAGPLMAPEEARAGIALQLKEIDQLRAELAAIKAQDTVGEVVGWYRLDRPYEMTPYPSVCATWHRLGAPVAPLYAAPASPAVDAGLVEAEEKVRHQEQIIDRMGEDLNAINGPTFMGEPVIRDTVEVSRKAIQRLFKAAGCSGSVGNSEVLNAASDRLNAAPVQQVSVPDGKVCVPVEVLRLYEFMAASFTPFTSQHEQIAISLRKAKAAMLAALSAGKEGA